MMQAGPTVGPPPPIHAQGNMQWMAMPELMQPPPQPQVLQQQQLPPMQQQPLPMQQQPLAMQQSLPMPQPVPQQYIMQQPAPMQQQQIMQQPMQSEQSQPPYHQAPQSYEEIRTLWVGDLEPWMDENYLRDCFTGSGEVVMSVKVIRNRQTMLSEGYGFVEFSTHSSAERLLQTLNGSIMPQTEKAFRLNWASYGAGEKRSEGSESIFVGDLATDVTDYVLLETFRACYPSVKGAKIVMDPNTGRPRGYGFVRFGDDAERTRALTEMNGVYLSDRPMRISIATSKKSMGLSQQFNPTGMSGYNAPSQVFSSDSDSNNTTIFVGGLDRNVTDEELRRAFAPFGEIVYVKVPVGKGCGFVQFTQRPSAEEAMKRIHGQPIGGACVRLSWGRAPGGRQVQSGASWGQQAPQVDPNQWNAGYYGYGQGYDGYSYVQVPQDPSAAYSYDNYSSFPTYPQQPQPM